MSEITCIRVGYGSVAQIHEKKMQQCGVKTVAVVEINEQRALQAQKDGFTVFILVCQQQNLIQIFGIFV